MADHALLHARCEDHAIDRERTAARNARLIGGLQYDTPELPHLGFEQTVRVCGFNRFERVAADQLGESIGLMRRRHPNRPHLVQGDADASFRERPGRLTAGEAATHDVNGHDMSCPYYDATSSGSGALSSTTIVCPHLRHLRVVSPVVLDLISSIPTKPQLGHGTTTGLFQVE